MRISKIFTIGLGLIFSSLFLAFAFAQVQWDSFFALLVSLDPTWNILVLLALLSAMFVRAVRWHVLTGLGRNKLSAVWNAACVGYFGTAVYPARAGDVLRLLRLQQTTGLPAGHVVGSGLTDRLVDGLSLAILLLVMVFFKMDDLQATWGLWFVALAFVLAACFVGYLAIRGHLLKSYLQRWAVKGSLQQRLCRLYDDCVSGLQLLREPRVVICVLLLQLLVTSCDILACWALFKAFSWNMPISASIFVLVCLAAAIALPSSPGYVGVYQVAALFALRAFGIEDTAAIAYGTVLHILNLALFVIIGGWGYWRKPVFSVGHLERLPGR